MFIDKVQITVQGGKGGNGCLSFRREKYIPFGGPNGGNGGRGGDLYFVADRNLTTLLDLTYKPHFKAPDGAHGSSWDKAGRGGEDFYVRVPCGTVVYGPNRHLMADLREDGQVFLVAHGGRGGRGNAAFKTKINTAPRIAENGEPGEEFLLDLELKLIADVGLVGAPNAGKSTLLSRLSAARPKIADYPFTTLSPNLGVAKFKDKSFVVADIPGLIEGAHQGKGLGMDFLRHVERTRVLVHIVDPFGFGGKTPLQTYRAIQKELELYSKKLAKTPTVVAVNKMDATGAEAELKKLRKALKGKKILGISAVSGQGLEDLFAEVVKALKKAKDDERSEPVSLGDHKKFVLEDAFTVEQEDGRFVVRGKRVERLAAMTNFEQHQAVSRFQNILKKMGVERMLQKQGVHPGDTIRIGPQEFIYQLPDTEIETGEGSS
jgi:GTP-binding protein